MFAVRKTTNPLYTTSNYLSTFWTHFKKLHVTACWNDVNFNKIFHLFIRTCIEIIFVMVTISKNQETRKLAINSASENWTKFLSYIKLLPHIIKESFQVILSDWTDGLVKT